MQMAACVRQDGTQGRVTGVFNAGVTPGVQQHLRREPKRVLRAHGHQHLILAGQNAPAWQDLTGDEFGQFRVVAVVVIGGHRGEVALAQCLQGAQPPVGAVKKRGVSLPVNKGILVVRPIGRPVHVDGRALPCAQHARPVHRTAMGLPHRKGRRLRRVVGDEISGSALRGQVIVRHQFGIGQRDGDPADPQMLRHLARGRQLFTGAEPPGEDALRDHLLDTGLQRAFGVRVEKESFD